MEAATAARILHDWAYAEALTDSASAATVSTAEEFDLIEDLSEQGIQILRNRRIRAIGFNEFEKQVIVFTKRAAPSTKRQVALLPRRVGDVEIRYRQGVPHAVEDRPPTAQAGPTYATRTVGTASRYTCGSSISVGNNREAGTLGCLVIDAAGNMYGLSNNHVCGGCSYAGVRLPIVAPGIYDVVPDGAVNPFTLGHHHRALPLVAGSPDNVDSKANLDAAIFKLLNPASVSSYQRNVYDTPGVTGAITPGMTVEKVGRTTEHTTGTVISQVYGATSISYQVQLYNFSGPVPFDPVFAIYGTTDMFSDAGDSGSLITATDATGNRLAVGIVVGGMSDGKAPGGKVTLALPIEPILAMLGVTLVSGHNV